MIITLLILFGASTFLVLHCAYEDGLFGRAALSMIAVASMVLLVHVVDQSATYAFLPETEMILVGVALFMARHVYRFMRWRISGEGSWRGGGKG